MGEHFWPSMYPGLIVGLLYGVSVGGLANAVFGALGGLAGAVVSFLTLPAFLSQDGLFPLATLGLASFASAYCTLQLSHLLARAVRTRAPKLK